MEIDTENLKSAFNINIDENALRKQTEKYMKEINNAITTNTAPAKKAFSNNLNTLADGMFNSIKGEFTVDDVDKIVDNYLKSKEVTKAVAELESKYVIPKNTFKSAYSGLLKGLLQVYVASYTVANSAIPQEMDNINMQELQNMDAAMLEPMQKAMQNNS